MIQSDPSDKGMVGGGGDARYNDNDRTPFLNWRFSFDVANFAPHPTFQIASYGPVESCFAGMGDHGIVLDVASGREQPRRWARLNKHWMVMEDRTGHRSRGALPVSISYTVYMRVDEFNSAIRRKTMMGLEPFCQVLGIVLLVWAVRWVANEGRQLFLA